MYFRAFFYFCSVNYLSKEAINQFIDTALQEDIGNGDHSSLASIPSGAQNKAQLIIKDKGIIAGVQLAETIFHRLEPTLKFSKYLNDGEKVKQGDIAFTIEGNAQKILTGERLVLNCMQRMSGIATYTDYLCNLIKGTKAKLLDTRKTTPNFRLMEKWAVEIGGGMNHRFGLFDMIILKDNHIDYAGGITKAILGTVDYLIKNNLNLKIEVETRNLKEVSEVIQCGKVDRIMLDNMDTETLKKSIELIDGQYETEASGGVTEKTIRDIALTGVDYISVGALTHSFKSLDMSLKAF
jgi:nicotinate-nucleotide pyrophosphorylase (carboxylating)